MTLTVTDNGGATAQVARTITPVTVSAIVPNSVAVGSSTNVTINGSGFAPGTTLSFENGTGGGAQRIERRGG